MEDNSQKQIQFAPDSRRKRRKKKKQKLKICPTDTDQEMEDNPEPKIPKIQFAPDSRSRRRRKIKQELKIYPTHDVQQQWREHWRGQREKTEMRRGVRRAPYGTHVGYQMKWDEDKQRFYPRGRAKQLPIYGPPNWDQIWPRDTDMGRDFMVKYPATQPLSDTQWANRNMHSHRYDIISLVGKLGSGAFGSVWRVECMLKNHQADKHVMLACKVIKPDVGEEPASIDKMKTLLVDLNVGMMVSWLIEWDIKDKKRKGIDFKAPNLIPYLDVITIPDEHTRFPYSAMLILMPICHGDLGDIIDEFTPHFVADELIRLWMNHISTALEYLHNQDIGHLDIKPPNVLFRASNIALPLTQQSVMDSMDSMIFILTDYGLAKMHLDSEQLTISQTRGTDRFKSPEMITVTQDAPVLTKPCDIYALGVTLFSCRSKFREWDTLTESMGISIAMAERIEKDDQLHTLTANERQFALLVQGMTQNDPSERFTIQDVIQHPYLNPVQAEEYRKIPSTSRGN